MKRFLIIFVAFLFLVIYVDKFDSNYYVIPDDSIRIRIIANSDSFDDQYIKIKVKQLIDLALLANNMLKGKDLAEFVKRSVNLL